MYQAIHFSMTILTTWTTKMLFLRGFHYQGFGKKPRNLESFISTKISALSIASAVPINLEVK